MSPHPAEFSEPSPGRPTAAAPGASGHHPAPATEPIRAQVVRHDRLGPYRIVQQLGEGGMGVVHLALDERGRAVAVKVLRDHIAHDPQARARLSREVTTLSRIQHPAVAAVIDADVDGPRPYVVTRYIPGPSLEAWVAERGPLQAPALVKLAVGLSEALQAIHAVGVVHRDLKPGNVLMLDGAPVVIDFGIAHLADDVRLTSSGLVMGTPGYLAPELIAGARVTEATDWWGWAATLAFAAQGRAPFGRGPIDLVIHRVVAGEYDLGGVDARLAPLLAAALDPNPARRPDRPVILRGVTRYADGGDTTQVLPLLSVLPMCPDPGTGAAVTQPVTVDPAKVSVPAGPSSAQTSQVTSLPGVVAEPLEPAGSAAASHGLPATQPQPVASTAPMPTAGTERPTPAYAGFAPAPIPSPPAGTAAPIPAPPAGAPMRPSPVWADPPVSPAAFPAVSPESSRAAIPDPVWLAPLDGRRPQPAGQPPVPTTGTSSDPRIGRSQRTGTLVAVGAALSAFAAVAPVLALLVGLVWATLARTADRTVTWLTLKRHERGARRSDVSVAVLASIPRVIASAVASILGALLPVLVALAAAVSVAFVQSSLTGRDFDLQKPLPLAAGAVVALLLSWWGAGSTSLRRGSRSLIRGCAPGSTGAAVASTVLVLLAAYLAVRTQASGAQASWWPLGGRPLAWLTDWF
ncbi:MAG TPA: protein kinase [Dermatophilaceae bacterium]|nr:protein kinase [Dermatophilaceae bacterium]